MDPTLIKDIPLPGDGLQVYGPFGQDIHLDVVVDRLGICGPIIPPNFVQWVTSTARYHVYRAPWVFVNIGVVIYHHLVVKGKRSFIRMIMPVKHDVHSIGVQEETDSSPYGEIAAMGRRSAVWRFVKEYHDPINFWILIGIREITI
jgi:hypothetical protein